MAPSSTLRSSGSRATGSWRCSRTTGTGHRWTPCARRPRSKRSGPPAPLRGKSGDRRPRRVNVVYLSPNGAGTALVRSQVLGYLRGLRERGIAFDLVTFERPADPPYPERDFPRAFWHPVVARPGGGLLAKCVDVA